MRSGIFGWSLPPGVSRLPGEESDPPCEVCCKAVEDCICPECPRCGTAGEPRCYAGHPRGHERKSRRPKHPHRVAGRRLPRPRTHGMVLTRLQHVARQEARVAVLRVRLGEEEQCLDQMRHDPEFHFGDWSTSPDPWRQ